ncbi:MAG: hypothetical protein HC869_24285, partial [Rhodospirillales bacterium]|nr:hypothetical protein [Rhodospirillales bacterium]
VYLVLAQPYPGWSVSVLAYGPPVVSVRFTSSSRTLTCTISADSDGIVEHAGDC